LPFSIQELSPANSRNRYHIEGLSLPAVGLRRDLHGSVKQIHHVKLKDSDKERPAAFPRIMFKQTDSDIQQLHGASERTQKHQRRRRLLRTLIAVTTEASRNAFVVVIDSSLWG
jgi:hypothetical protein